ncbi:MAG: hypothetical protein ABSE73_21110, partial [Planctomycetota bacterium]
MLASDSTDKPPRCGGVSVAQVRLCTRTERVHVSKCTAGVPPARGRLAECEGEGGRDARGTLWLVHLL